MHVNLWLLLFNLIPVPPLDGSKILYARFSAGIDQASGMGSRWATFRVRHFFTADANAHHGNYHGPAGKLDLSLLSGSTMKKRILSGMQPTGGGKLHLGNLEGALRPWVKLQGRVRDVLLRCGLALCSRR